VRKIVGIALFTALALAAMAGCLETMNARPALANSG
jgi:hypothetical protein